MSEQVVDLETGEITDPEPETEPDPEPEVEPTEDDAEPEPEPEPEPGDEELRVAANEARAQTEAEVASINTALGKEAQRHAKRIVEIMGGDAEILEVCPLCLPLVPGFRYPQVPQGEQFAAVKAAIGEPAEPELQADTYSVPCDKCGGFGNVSTGSKVAGFGKATCHDCKGRGWLPRGPERESGSVVALASVSGAIDYTQASPDAPEPPEVTALKATGQWIVVPIIPPAA